ncbi:MAG TPA: MlaD family protein [Burkholderiales bacterium]|nr:MlaD family protein [Burkholderiales bacterium]
MKPKAHYFRVGSFILIGIVLLIALAIALGGGGLFKRTVTIETYFNGTVQGLDVGSKVKYRGVLIGEVTKLGFTSNRYESHLPPTQRKPYVYVEAKLDLEQAGFNTKLDAGLLQRLIDKGLRIRMSAQGITGTYFLEIDYLDPARASPPLPISWQPVNLYLPSGASTVTQILERADRFLAHFEQMNLPKVATDLDALLLTLNAKLVAVDAKAIGNDTRAMVADLRETASRINKVLAGPEAEAAVRDAAAATSRLRKLLDSPGLDTAPQDAAVAMSKLRALLEGDELQNSLKHLESTLQSVDKAVAGKDPDITTIIDNLRRTSENLRDLSESLKRYPGALFADPPQRLETLPQR